MSVENVVKRFGGVRALAGCSLEVRRGTITGLIGPNGSGKSSIINVLTGFYTPDGGRVRFRGERCDGLKPHQLRARGIARSFQETRVFPRLTVLENVVAATGQGQPLLGLLAPRVSKEEEAEGTRLLELLGLARLKHTPAGELSYGQQKLVDLAGVFIDAPDLVLLDEPAAGINPVLSEQIMEFVRRQNAEGKTILMIDHDMGVIMSYCDPVIVMDAGQKVAEGSPETVQADPRVLEAYLGE